MEPPKVKRTRKGGQRSRTGCATCRIRHIKCDESRPFCDECVSTGRKCDGYSGGQESKKKELIFAPPIVVSKVLPQTTYLLSQKEAQHLNHFRHVFARGMSGYVSSPVWEKMLLQALHDEPAVRCAAIAFTALQTPTHLSPMSSNTKDLVFALKQYSASIKALQKLLTQETPRAFEAALACSAICTSFEVLEGSHLLALGHFDNSLRLISANEKIIDQDISRAFARLDVQASTYVGNRTPIMAPKTTTEDLEAFFDVKEADDSLFRHLNETWRFIYQHATPYRYLDEESIPLSIRKNLESLTRRLSKWKEVFLNFKLENHERFCARDIEHTKLLEIHHCAGTVLLSGEISAHETVYDMFDDEFQSIVSLSRELLQSRLLSPWGESFSIEMGVVQPLYIAAIKCRVPAIRAAAIELLYLVPRPEGIWNGQAMARIAEQAKLIEEADTDVRSLTFERLPEYCRIHSITSDIDQHARTADFICDMRRRNKNGEFEQRHGTVTW